MKVTITALCVAVASLAFGLTPADASEVNPIHVGTNIDGWVVTQDTSGNLVLAGTASGNKFDSSHLVSSIHALEGQPSTSMGTIKPSFDDGYDPLSASQLAYNNQLGTLYNSEILTGNAGTYADISGSSYGFWQGAGTPDTLTLTDSWGASGLAVQISLPDLGPTVSEGLSGATWSTTVNNPPGDSTAHYFQNINFNGIEILNVNESSTVVAQFGTSFYRCAASNSTFL